MRAFLAGQQALQRRLRPPEAPDEEIARNQRLVWTWDSLSLGLLLDWSPFELRGVPTAGELVDVAVTEGTLDPWPFAAESVTVKAEARRLAGRYDDEAAMRSALTRAPWITLERELRPGRP